MKKMKRDYSGSSLIQTDPISSFISPKYFMKLNLLIYKRIPHYLKITVIKYLEYLEYFFIFCCLFKKFMLVYY